MQALLGHKSIATTVRCTHTDCGRLRTVVANLRLHSSALSLSHEPGSTKSEKEIAVKAVVQLPLLGVATISRIRSLSVMKSSDSHFGYTRREAFRLGMSSLAAAWFGSPVGSALAETTIAPAPAGPYTLPPLPYPYEALEPQIDTITMQIHHDKHHKAYVDTANKLLADQPEFAKLSPEDLLKNLSKAPEAIRTGLRNNIGGHVNHSLFWQMMSPKGGGNPSGGVAKAIEKEFKSFDEFQKQFNDAAVKRFGSGWAWLAAKDEKLEIFSSANQDSPVTDGHVPLLGLDVWEHAYYLPKVSEPASGLYCGLVELDKLGLRERAVYEDVSSLSDLRKSTPARAREPGSG